jgi:hypothetical protein
MKLSEAILLGSIGTKQCKLFLQVDDKACAIGAALYGTGYKVTNEDAAYAAFDELFPIQATIIEQCPHAECKSKTLYRSLGDMLFHLNDCHEWERPRIANWVATVEDQQQTKELNGGLIEEEVQLR